jgi:EAL domain-containing protein (putative c-di-GMP-specific phosphodiesterase class I)
MRLADKGVTLSIDDFGTGFSSLAHLKLLPVHELKIDKSFVLNMRNNDNDAVIVHSTIDLGHNLGLKVVAEGVEDVQTLNLLRARRCDLIQGYLISRPVPLDELIGQALQETTTTAG